MTYHVEELTLFVGTREQATMAALLDNDVYYINDILAHKGKQVVGGSVAEGITQRYYASIIEAYIYN